ncbi:ead/Ea22-like family protein [Citrobacter freundii]|uniref:ead/Ea22-like family protein n=1 Tax=Citrobacter freundii TaxID=546 RepID=UPI0023B010D1|nr:ead/Ea22-like family protein [Citrobacter freundii]
MSNIDKQALREEFQLMQDHYSDPADRERQVIYIAAEALLDELDAAEKLATQQGNIAAALLDEVTTLRRNADDKAPELRTQLIEADNELEALRQRIAELEARAFNLAILDVIAERQRQQSVEGWTPEHDGQYGKSQLLWASSCYLLNTIQPFNRIPMDWPWDSSWWKPTNPRRDLVKAGALILAEIERIDRAAGIGVKGE